MLNTDCRVINKLLSCGGGGILFDDTRFNAQRGTLSFGTMLIIYKNF